MARSSNLAAAQPNRAYRGERLPIIASRVLIPGRPAPGHRRAPPTAAARHWASRCSRPPIPVPRGLAAASSTAGPPTAAATARRRPPSPASSRSASPGAGAGEVVPPRATQGGRWPSPPPAPDHAGRIVPPCACAGQRTDQHRHLQRARGAARRGRSAHPSAAAQTETATGYCTRWIRRQQRLPVGRQVSRRPANGLRATTPGTLSHVVY